MLNAIMISTAALTILIIFQIVELLTWKQKRLKNRLKMSLSLPARQPVNEERQNLVKRLGGRAKGISLPKKIIGRRYLDKLQASLVKAGIPLKPEEMIFFTLVLVAILTVVGALLFQNIWAAPLSGVFGLAGPLAWVNYMERRRMNSIELQLLDAVVLMANSLRGGHSFMQALELVSRETQPPLSEELAKVVKETKVGISTEEALKNLNKRVQSKDLELVITAVLLQRQVGGNLAAILDTVADTIEKRIRMKAKIRTLTAQGRLSAWIVCILPFALAVMVFTRYPEFSRVMFTEPAGILMGAVGLVLMIIGIIVIRRVVDIDV